MPPKEQVGGLLGCSLPSAGARGLHQDTIKGEREGFPLFQARTELGAEVSVVAAVLCALRC